MNGVDDLGVVDSSEVHRGDRQVGVSELALDHKQWYALAGTSRRHGRAGAGGERTGDGHQPPRQPGVAGCGSRPARKAARGSGRAARRTAHLPEGAHGPGARARGSPRPSGPYRPRAVCRPCRYAPAQRRASGQDRSRSGRALRRSAKAGTPEYDDYPAQPDPIRVIPDGAHDRDDLLDRRRVGRIAQPLLRGARP